MAFLAAAAPYIGLGTAALGAVTALEQGKGAAANAKLQAAQDERDASNRQVEAQMAAAKERRKARYLRSRALAVAGASGAGVSDPTINNILADIDTEGEMNALNTLWAGDEEARALRLNAGARRREGEAIKGASYGQAVSSLAGGLSDVPSGTSFFKKYGSERAYGMSPGGRPSMSSFASLGEMDPVF